MSPRCRRKRLLAVCSFFEAVFKQRVDPAHDIVAVVFHYVEREEEFEKFRGYILEILRFEDFAVLDGKGADTFDHEGLAGFFEDFEADAVVGHEEALVGDAEQLARAAAR